MMLWKGNSLGRVRKELALRSITGGRYPFALNPIFLLTTGDWERTFLQSLLSISSYSGYSWVAAYWHLCRNLNWTWSTKISHNMWARLRGVRTTLNAVFKRLKEGSCFSWRIPPKQGPPERETTIIEWSPFSFYPLLTLGMNLHSHPCFCLGTAWANVRFQVFTEQLC